MLNEIVDACEASTKHREIISIKAGVLKSFEDFGSDSIVLSRLLACNISDVYGGWAPGTTSIFLKNLAEYSKVSSDFYLNLQEYKAAVLCSVKNKNGYTLKLLVLSVDNDIMQLLLLFYQNNVFHLFLLEPFGIKKIWC